MSGILLLSDARQIYYMSKANMELRYRDFKMNISKCENGRVDRAYRNFTSLTLDYNLCSVVRLNSFVIILLQYFNNFRNKDNVLDFLQIFRSNRIVFGDSSITIFLDIFLGPFFEHI